MTQKEWNEADNAFLNNLDDKFKKIGNQPPATDEHPETRCHRCGGPNGGAMNTICGGDQYDSDYGRCQPNTTNKAGSSSRFRTYVCRYFHNDRWWTLDLIAENQSDAESRVEKLGRLQLLGELKIQIPAKPGVGLFIRAVCWCRNWLTKVKEEK